MEVTSEQRESWKQNTQNSPFNHWLRERVNRPDGTLDLDRLQRLAAEYGIDWRRYEHLNPGQQRMNIGNRLRAIVPESAYVNQDIASGEVKGTTPLAGGTCEWLALRS